MRAVGGRGFLLAGVCALSVLAVDQPVAHAEQAQPVSARDAAGATDYYTRRAKDILSRERARAAKPHPLAAAYPSEDIVVCEAGCVVRRGAHVVFARPVTTEERHAIMVPTSNSPSGVSENGVNCIAGCYGETAVEYKPVTTRAAKGVQRMELPARDALSPIR